MLQQNDFASRRDAIFGVLRSRGRPPDSPVEKFIFLSNRLLHLATMCDDHLPTAQQALQQREEVPKADEFRTKSEQFLGHYSLIFRGMTTDHKGVCNAYERLTMRRQVVLQPSDVEKEGGSRPAGPCPCITGLLPSASWVADGSCGKRGPRRALPREMSKIDRLLWDLYYTTESRLRQFFRGAISVF
eukprot:jgi/Botrbrau1/14760/Bobra.0103s0010.1